MPAFRSLTATTALMCTLCAPLSAQEASSTAEIPVTIWDVLSVETFLTMAVQSLMPSARVLADIRYDQIDIDIVRNRIALEGVDIRPDLPYADADACVITADALVMSGAPIDRQQGYQVKAALDGAVLDFDCLPNEAKPFVGLSGLENIRMDRTQLFIHYDFASGGADISLVADVDDLLALTASADFDYISYRMDFETEDVDPSAYLNAAQLTIEDRGLFEVAARMAPPEFLDPANVGALVQGGLSQAFADLNAPGAPLTGAQQSLALQAAEVAQRTVQNPGSIVLESAISGGSARLSEADFDDPNTLLNKLNMQISTAPRAVNTAITAAELKQAIDGLLPAERNFDVGRALVTGIGAPRNLTLGLRLLEPLAKDGNAQASFVMARALASSDAPEAYRLALQAASRGIKGAYSLLGTLETDLTLAQILEGQDALLGGGGPVASDFGGIGQIRRAARAHLRGTTRIRSYRAAYYWASVGAAAGDTASASIRDEIDTIMRLRGAAAAWREVRVSLENGVLRDWVGRDLPAKLQE